MGSKNRIAKHILPIMLMEAYIKGVTTWVEPFVGGGNMIDKVPNIFQRIGIDINPHTIAALIAIRDYVNKLPDELTERDYIILRGTEPDPITSWLRFVCSYSGIFEIGYARHRGSDASTYVRRGKLNAKKQSPKLQGVKLIVGSYDEYSDFEHCLIYCDPPYQGTTEYKTQLFDHAKFWDWCREMSKTNIVFISEYQAPPDFACVWEGEIKNNVAYPRKQATVATERLFIYSRNILCK